MSVQTPVVDSNYFSMSPITICIGNSLLSYNTKSSIVTPKEISPGFNQSNNTVWSYYWNNSNGVTVNSVPTLKLFC